MVPLALIDDALDTLAERRGIWLGDDLATMTLIARLIEQAGRLESPAADSRLSRPAQGLWMIKRLTGGSQDRVRTLVEPVVNRHGFETASVLEEDGRHHVEALPARGS
ncbi:hypothetical protein GCM10022267_67340 [Lentzea roselyniae]|uniref:Uncharacterized protein n=1 Tax=Lentzea roselyniae TaxID=531940 RepID=A0ABP7BYM9_9PSEU